jgi:predicted Zn-dependent protease
MPVLTPSGARGWPRLGRAALLVWPWYALTSSAEPSAQVVDVPGSEPVRTSAPATAARKARPATPASRNRPVATGSQRPEADSLPPASVGTPVPWGHQGAMDQVLRGQRQEAAGEAGRALRAYLAAIQMDPAYGPAYLALGKLRERLGDFSEAEQCYSAATRLEPTASEGLVLRARLRKRLGRVAEATRDLEAALEKSPTVRSRWDELVRWYVELGAWPAALATCRRLLRNAELGVELTAKERAEIRRQVTALGVLAAETDPVMAGRGETTNWVRRSVATIAWGRR